jgi:diadenosine tetraphosphatase ApaH/serine/threonine PP2A family protein phosphatase
MFIKLYEHLPIGEPLNDLAMVAGTIHNGMSWWCDIDEITRQELLAEFRKMPYAMEVDTDNGPYGIVHADIPHNTSWQEFCHLLENGHKRTIEIAIWSRTRINYGLTNGVEGISIVYVGHTPIARPISLGNVRYIDTGCVFGARQNDSAFGRLTLVELTIQHDHFTAAEANAMADVRLQPKRHGATNIIKA